MANRNNHYEAAFEEYLRFRGIPYVAVDESRRAIVGDDSLKSLDYIVSPAGTANWLVDVKGRRFPSGLGLQYWKNWSTHDDLKSLARWEELFGERFRGLFVFAYFMVGARAPLPDDELFNFRDRRYGFVAVRLTEYAYYARRISPRWDTYAMPTRRFREFAEPFDMFLKAAPAQQGEAVEAVTAPEG